MTQQWSIWQRVKTGSKSGFDKFSTAVNPPVNRSTQRLASEAFWPTTLDKESDKAARILKSFCRDGFYVEEDVSSPDALKRKQKVVQKIPANVIQQAKGLAIFTTMRTGLWVGGAGGSGILVAKKSDGSWSPPSAVMLHTSGLGFLVGVDLYDGVIVINTDQALDAFTKVRCTLGGDISAIAGPLGVGAVVDSEVNTQQAPIYTYLKSRGFYAAVQIDGTIVVERFDENEKFYGQKLSASEILAGKVQDPPLEVKRLMQTIKAAQGDTDFDQSALPTEPPPGDFEIESEYSIPSVPDKDDPDPYGVLALEKEGMSLKEAGTQKRASWEQFSFNPSPTSPLFNIYSRQSQDAGARPSSRRNSWRSSALTCVTEPRTPRSLRTSVDHRRRSTAVMTDTSTQTDLDLPGSPSRRSVLSVRSGNSRHSSKGSVAGTYMEDLPEEDTLKTGYGGNPLVSVSNGYDTPPCTPPGTSLPVMDDAAATHQPNSDTKSDPEPADTDLSDTEQYDDVEIVEQPMVQSVQTIQPVTSSQLFASKARLVNVPKRLPPRLPPRNPSRTGPLIINASPISISPKLDEKMDESDDMTDASSDDTLSELSPKSLPVQAPSTDKMPGGFD